VRALADIRSVALDELCNSVTLTTRNVYVLPDL